MKYLGSVVATVLVNHALSPSLVAFFGIRVPPVLDFTWQMKDIILSLAKQRGCSSDVQAVK